MKLQSDLQQKFRLSPRKFWKKMIVMAAKLFFVIVLICITLIPATFSMKILLGKNVFLGIDAILGSTFLGIILFFGVLLILCALYIKAYIKTYLYAGEDLYLTIQKGVFTPSEIHVQYMKIQDVYVDQDIIDRILGIYDVHIASATAASGIEAHIDGVDRAAADGLKKFLFDKFSRPQQGFTQVSTAAANATPVSAPALSLSEKISNVTYPLSNTWVGIQVAAKILGSCAIATLIAIPLFVSGGGLPFQSSSSAFLILVGFVIFWAGLHVGAFLLWKSNYAFDFTPEHIYGKSGVLSISEKHMPYSSIQDVTVRQGFIERLFGLASVRIENAAAQTLVRTRNGSRAIFPGIIILGISLADAQKITTLLKRSMLGKNSARYGL